MQRHSDSVGGGRSGALRIRARDSGQSHSRLRGKGYPRRARRGDRRADDHAEKADAVKTRIELRQIGVRDKSKRIGGLGPCGLFLCCNSFLTDFNSVSINMAKNQMLALNPSKINGICGRLLCCLAYENDTYSELKKNLPKLGSVIETSMGSGKVSSVNVLKNTYSVDLKEKGIVEFDGVNDESSK